MCHKIKFKTSVQVVSVVKFYTNWAIIVIEWISPQAISTRMTFIHNHILCAECHTRISETEFSLVTEMQ